MGDFEACPACGKDVVGRPPLLAHLEFSHQVADPGAHLRALEHPADPGRGLTTFLVWGGAGLAGLVVVVVGALLVSGGSSDGPAVDVAAAATTVSSPDEAPPEASVPTSAPPTTPPPSTTAPPTTDSVPAAVDLPPTTGAPRAMSGGGAISVEDFRAPFLRDARVIRCSPADGSDVYLVEFTLSGARDIVLDGVEYPGRTGDGERRVEHAAPSGIPSWLGHVDVGDADGTQHRVEIFPALYLTGC